MARWGLVFNWEADTPTAEKTVARITAKNTLLTISMLPAIITQSTKLWGKPAADCFHFRNDGYITRIVVVQKQAFRNATGSVQTTAGPLFRYNLGG